MYVAAAVWKVSRKTTQATRSLRKVVSDWSFSGSGTLCSPGIPWVPIPGGIVVVPLDNARSVHGTLSIRCEPKVGDEPGGRGIR